MEEKKKEILSAGGIWLETERMILRDHRWEDLESHHGLISDPDAMYYLPEILTHNLEESRMDLESSIEAIGKPDRREYFLRMEDKETGELIGETGYTVTQEHPVGKLVHTRRWTWRQSENGKVEPSTTRIAFPIDGFTGVNEDEVRAACEELAAVLRDEFGARAEVFLASVDAPSA